MIFTEYQNGAVIQHHALGVRQRDALTKSGGRNEKQKPGNVRFEGPHGASSSKGDRNTPIVILWWSKTVAATCWICSAVTAESSSGTEKAR